MGVTLTPVVTVLGDPVVWEGRYGPQHERFGDPYTGGLAVYRRGAGAELRLLCGDRPQAGDYRELRRLLRLEGVESFWYERRGSDKYKEVRL